jgi:hypothetical protein
MNGHGTITKTNGETITGQWRDGDFVPDELEDEGTQWMQMRKTQTETLPNPVMASPKYTKLYKQKSRI